MMRRTLLLIGFLVAAPMPAVAATQLYDIFLDQVKQEFSNEKADDPVIEFLRGIYDDRWPMTEDEVKAAILGQPWKACVPDDDTAPQRVQGECDDAMQNIRQLAEEEQTLRTFGRTMQRIAAGQELPISEIPGRPFRLATDLSGIVNIWRAGTGSVQQTITGAMLLRTWSPKEDTPQYDRIRDAIDDIVEEYSALNDEQRVAVISRYQYGIRLVRNERSPRYPGPADDGRSEPGTERQYVFKRWEKLEDALLDAYRGLPTGDTLDPPLSANEVAYVLLPDDLKNALPDNVLLWLRVGPYVSGGDDPIGDAGLAWVYPIEPLLPSLLSDKENEKDEPILGGAYPPEPATPRSSNDDGSPAPPGATTPLDGRGLCSMALAQRGFLCRPLKPGGEQRCPDDDVSDDENVITLVSCTLDEEPTVTVAGADACREIEWKNDAREERCTVDVTCGECLFNGKKYSTFTYGRNGQSVPVCIDDDSGIPATYAATFALTHAQFLCKDPGKAYYELDDEEEKKKMCCALEGAAAAVLCKRLTDDGVLLDGKNPIVVDGVEISSQVCMEVFRNQSCQLVLDDPEFRCPQRMEYPPAILETIVEKTKANPNDVPESCEDIQNRENLDPAIAARFRTIERHVPICEPGTESAYKNTIGNNACYIGQCVEETLELHRVTGGRSPATVGDEAFPWDTPETGTALATMLRSVPAANPPLPSYRPQLVMRVLEDALCQLQGLPAATPPHLCAFSSSRRLAVPLPDGASTAQSLVYSADEQREATRLMEELGASLGSRIGADMQGQYLRIGTRTLSEVVALANTLLKELKNVRFPANMCTLSQ